MRACQKLASKLPMAMADGGSFEPGYSLLTMGETPRMKNGGDLKTGKGGRVPGTGQGDKIGVTDIHCLGD